MTPFVFFPDKLKANLIQRGLLLAEPLVGDVQSDQQAMKLAIQEAYRGLGFTSPNPLVGCVILDGKNQFLAKGFHARIGQGHAEVQALQGLSHEKLKGARIFVTLEPCAHEGRTPSCARAIAKLPVKEVIFGLIDPNPLVAGLGAKILRDAGIRTTVFSELKKDLEMQNSLLEVCEHFLWNQLQKKVFVSLKIASSLDGQLALKNGESKWITDEASREIAHVLRAAHEGLLVGAGTILADNPSLNIRHPLFQKRNRLIILDSRGALLARAAELKLGQTQPPEEVIFVLSDQTGEIPNPWGAQVLRIPSEGNQLNLKILLTKLWDLGVKSLLVEGGAQVLSSFISEGVANRLYLFQAPLILGAKGGKAWTEQVSIWSMKEKIPLHQIQYIPLDQDQLITGKLQ